MFETSPLRRSTAVTASAMGLVLAGSLVQLPAHAAAAPRLRAKSTIRFDGTGDGVTKTTSKVWVPNGGEIGVYGQNTGTWGTTHLDFWVYRYSDNRSREVTNNFWRAWEPTGEHFLRHGETVNKRIANKTGRGHYYYIRARCDIRTGYKADCDGSFTVSSWH